MFLLSTNFCYEVSVSIEEFIRAGVPSCSHPLFHVLVLLSEVQLQWGLCSFPRFPLLLFLIVQVSAAGTSGPQGSTSPCTEQSRS